MAETCFWVIRHGESQWNEEGRIQGQLDIDLNARGRRQSAMTARFLKGVPFDAVWSSDLRRAAFLGKLIATDAGVPHSCDPMLREWMLGEFQGQLLSDLYEAYPEQSRAFMRDAPNTTIPGGESYSEILRRSAAAFDRLACLHRRKRVAVVSHGGVLRMLLKHVVKGDCEDQPHRVAVDNCAICRFSCAPGGTWRLLDYHRGLACVGRPP